MDLYSEGLHLVPATASSELLNAALSYAAQGFYVFPTHDIASGSCSCKQVCGAPGKHPRTPSGFKDSTTDPVQIAFWWKTWPRANIAIDCGRSGVVVVDVDTKHGAQGKATIRWFVERSLQFQQTHMIRTPSGGDHYYFRGDWRGDKHPFGPGVDVQRAGAYVLVPPSVAFGSYGTDKQPIPGSQAPYVVIRPAPMADFPVGIIPSAPTASNDTYDFTPREYKEGEREAIPYGEHRQFVLWLTWHLRAVHGLSVEAALPVARFCITSGVLEGYDPQRPFSDNEIRAALRRVSVNTATVPPPNATASLSESVVPAAVVLAEPVALKRHFIPNLVYQGALHAFYGPPGLGKTTIAAGVAADISRQGGDVLVFISEDAPRDFALTYHLSGGVLDRLYIQRSDVRQLLLPRATPELEQLIASRQWGAIYFDSILDMKSTDVRLNAAESARALFGPLQTFAERYNTTILCTAHTNKAGVFEGSMQFKAKCRVFARVSKPKPGDDTGDEYDFSQDSNWTSIVTNEKSNKIKAGARYAFRFRTVPALNPMTNRVELELDRDGNTREISQYVVEGMTELSPAETPEQEVASPRADLHDRIDILLRENPAMSANSIALIVGGRRSDVFNIVKKLKGEKNVDGAPSVSNGVL